MAKQKQTVKLKEPVRIRFKQLSNGNQSIYLEYYTGDVIRKENYVGGKRKYEFLKLYLIPERTREDKAKNEGSPLPKRFRAGGSSRCRTTRTDSRTRTSPE